MKQERIILSFIAALVGLACAGIIFFLYQGTRSTKLNSIKQVYVAKKNSKLPITSSAPLKTSSIFLKINQPENEQVFTKANLTISGQTLPSATVAILTASSQQIVAPDAKGNFADTLVLQNGENLIQIVAVATNGQEKVENITATYSLKQF